MPYIKAKTYYDKTKITTIGIDTNLYIEGLSEGRKTTKNSCKESK